MKETRQLVFEKKIEEGILEKELYGIFYVDYYEMPSGSLQNVKVFSAGSLTVNQLANELDKLYDENLEVARQFDELCRHLATIAIYIGFFDENENLHVVASRYYHGI